MPFSSLKRAMSDPNSSASFARSAVFLVEFALVDLQALDGIDYFSRDLVRQRWRVLLRAVGAEALRALHQPLLAGAQVSDVLARHDVLLHQQLEALIAQALDIGHA